MTPLAAPSRQPWSEPPCGLFVTDLDGTLLDAEGRVPEANRAAVARAEAAGVAVAVVTGRRRSTIGEIHAQLSPCRYRFSTSNGAVVLAADHASPEAVRDLPWEGVLEVARLPVARAARVLCITLPPTPAPGEEMPVDLAILEPASDRWWLAPKMAEPDGWRPADRDAVRAQPLLHVAVWVETREEAERIEPAVRAIHGDRASVHSVTFPRTSTGLCEVVPRGGKGNAVQHLAQVLGVGPERTGAIGDDMNDGALLDAAAHRYAVGGSVLAARRSDAVADALDRFLETVR